jgi:phosphatidylserine/phosphatidylglycerophosphate/cardiolipin synthase-like enzyme
MRFILFFFTIALIGNLYAKTNLYLLPKETKLALNSLLSHINKAESEIEIAIYSFTHRSISKALKNAAARGVKITLFFDHESNYKNRRSQLGYLAKLKNVTAYTIKGLKSKNGKYYGKMHMKLITIDQKTIFLGSANWSYSAFGLSYETFFVSDEKLWIDKTNTYLKEIKTKAKLYF